MKFKSITTQMSLFFGVLMFIICLGFGTSTYFSTKSSLKASIDESLTEIAKADAKIINEKINTQLNALEVLAENPRIKSNDISMQEKIEMLKVEVERSGHKAILFTETDGTAHSTNGDIVYVKDKAYFLKALNGEANASDPIINMRDGSVVVDFAVPIKDGDTVTGVLIARRDGNEFSTYTEEMQFNEREVFIVNNEGTVVASNDRNNVLNMYNFIKEAENNTDLADLSELVKKMADGEKGVGEYTYNGESKYMGFHPVEGMNWSLAVTAPKSVVMSKIDQLTTLINLIFAFFLIFGLGITILIARNISRPIKEASKKLNIMSTGDFTVDISEKLLARQDEIGNLAHSLDKMKSSMCTMIKAVADECTNVGLMLSDINNHMINLNQNIEEISSTTEQLSAGIEETAASSEEMNATSLEVEKAIESVAAKAQEGAVTSGKVSQMSEEMKNSAIASKQKALEIYSRTKTDLQNAIEKSKAVNQINELSNAILNIASQTNLLALNASIEAARAGEAGRGFSIVANEIRKLSENSKTSVSKIQEMVNEVLSAVNNLSSSSTEIMEFIDKKVLNDYEDLVQKSERYHELSMVINDIVTEFSSISEELLASMQNMVQAITQISSSANEEASGASNIAQKTEAIVNMTENVANLTNKSNEIAETLINLVKQFKI